MAIVWEKITRKDEGGKNENGLRRTQTINTRFNLDDFTDGEEEIQIDEFWESDFDNELASVREQITALEERETKVESRKTKLTAKWQSL